MCWTSGAAGSRSVPPVAGTASSRDGISDGSRSGANGNAARLPKSARRAKGSRCFCFRPSRNSGILCGLGGPPRGARAGIGSGRSSQSSGTAEGRPLWPCFNRATRWARENRGRSAPGVCGARNRVSRSEHDDDQGLDRGKCFIALAATTPHRRRHHGRERIRGTQGAS